MNGVVNVNKVSGCSSFSVVDSLKKILKTKKCGHIGTLDPIAEGVLPVCINQATKLSDYLMAKDKEYIASVRLGIKTDTMDITGKILNESNKVPDLQDIKEILSIMIGQSKYKIPAFSAVKISGQRAYKLARKGLINDAGTRTMTVYEAEVLSYSYPELMIRVFCEKGTYIRSLIDFLGDNLGSYASMQNLIRTRNGIFDIKNSFRLSEIEEMAMQNDFSFIIPMEKAIDWPISVIKDEYLERFLNGAQIPKNGYIKLPIEEESDLFWITDRFKNVLGFSQKNEGKDTPLKAVKIFKD